MRVLILLAFVGIAIAETYLSGAPLEYASYNDRPAYEYGSNVQTPSYNYNSYVRSGDVDRKLIRVAGPIIATKPEVTYPLVVVRKPFASLSPVYTRQTSAYPFYQPYYRFDKDGEVFEYNPALRKVEINSNTETADRKVTESESKPESELETKFIEVQPTILGQFDPLQPLLPVVPAQSFFPTGQLGLVPAVKSTPAQIVDRVQGLQVTGEGILPQKTQYHTQNELGEATYGHAEPTQSHHAVQDAYGNKAGTFSYVSPNGRILTTNYVADQDGYRVASNALPGGETSNDQPKSRKRRSIHSFVVAPTSYVRAPAPVYTNSAVPFGYSYWTGPAYSPYAYSSIGQHVIYNR